MALAVAGIVGAPAVASAKPRVTRKGGQWGVMLGGSACIPGTKTKCSRDDLTDVGVAGKTRPSFGMGVELGYRLNKWVFLGAAYNLGFLSPDYEIVDEPEYDLALQNSVYAVIRPSVPVWRFDFGADIAPGFSRLAFRRKGGDKDYSQGFSFKVGPVIDIFITKRIFLGAKLSFLFNAHGKTCEQRGNQTTCVDHEDKHLTPIHQMLFGLHVGGTFL